MVTITDLFCGAGGSSTGAMQVPDVQVRIAANHWQLAVDVHNANHPDADHAAVDLHEENPRFFPRTDVLWASPECTKWSQAAGKKRPAIEEGLFADPNADDAAVRSRLLMFDVLRFAEHHQYAAIIVENVVDIAVSSKYALAWAEWQRQLRNLGYLFRVVSVNSMHAQAHGLPAPQSRDRIYIVAWKKGGRAPDLDAILRPQAWCPRCEQMVESQQSWKNGRTVGKYRSQYVYVHGACGTVVEPGWLPASSAIDWTIPGQIIGARDRPLAPKTRARIAAGIARYWLDPFLMDRRFEYRVRGVDDPLSTLTANDTSKALLVPVEGRDGKDVRAAWQPHRTQTTRHETGLVSPFILNNQFGNVGESVAAPMPTLTTATTKGVVQPFIAELRGGGSDARTTAEPLATFAANGQHHALLMRNNTGGAEMSTPVHEYMRTITTAAHQSLIQHAAPRAARERVSDDALAAADRLVDECHFRMLTPLEAARGMAFPDTYRWDTAEAKKISNRDLVKLAGNAVTPPAARDLVHAVAESLGAAA